MKIAIFGGTGFVGKHLQKALKKRSHDFVLLDVRKDPGWKSAIKDCDAVINLAGAPLFGKRWDDQYKSLLHSSRVEGTHEIVSAMGANLSAGGKSKTLVNASAVGYYGSSVSQVFDESSPPGTDFLAFVCREWEDQAIRAEREFGIRTSRVRFGVILGADGGAMQKILPPFKAFVGGPMGLGTHFFPWVHIDDAVGILLHASESASVSGPLNAVSPETATNKEFAKTLGKVLKRPAFFAVPGLALHVLVGEAADMLTDGQKVLPRATLNSGYVFKFPKLESALREILK